MVRDRHVFTCHNGRKSYMESRSTSLDLTSIDFEGQSQGHFRYAHLLPIYRVYDTTQAGSRPKIWQIILAKFAIVIAITKTHLNKNAKRKGENIDFWP